jgi:hypothetical protein
VRRSILLLATGALTVGAAVGVFLVSFATGDLYIDEPDPDPPLAHAWLWVAAVVGATGAALAIVGALRNLRLWLLGAIPLAALSVIGLVLLV